jgi:hypothetical protein
MHLWKLRFEFNLSKAILAAILWTGLTTGCSVLGRTAVPTPFPDDFIETAIKMTVEAGELSTSAAILNPSTPEATETPTPEDPSQNPESPESTPNQSGGGASSPLLPTEAFIAPPEAIITTPTPGIPEAHIQIDRPGPMSKITSTLNVVGSLMTVPDGHMRIELWLEPLTAEGQPRLLLRELQNFTSNPSAWIYIAREFNVEISRLSEFAQLRVSTYDAENRMVALTSIDLLLLSVGEPEVNPPGLPQERIVILEPGDNKLIQGGTAFVSGLVHPSGDQYLTVNMITPDGKVIGIQQIAVMSSPVGGYVPFSVEVPYSVSETTRVRLAVYESTGRIAGITHLSSIMALVSP